MHADQLEHMTLDLLIHLMPKGLMEAIDDLLGRGFTPAEVLRSMVRTVRTAAGRKYTITELMAVEYLERKEAARVQQLPAGDRQQAVADQESGIWSDEVLKDQ